MATMYRLVNNGSIEMRSGIHPVDFGPYFNDGWSLSPPTTEVKTNAHEQSQELQFGDEIETPQTEETKVTPTRGYNPLLPIETRLAELQTLATDGDWRGLKAIAEGHGITRPNDGWDAAVSPILVAEYGQPAVDDLDE